MTKIELKHMYFQMFTLPNFTFNLIVGNYMIYYGNLSYNGISGNSAGLKIYNIKPKKSHDFNFCAAELTV